jgi:hypothetical protein
MPGSVAAELRAKLSPEMLAVCLVLDRELEREFPPASGDAADKYRDGRRDGMIHVRTMIERQQVS